MVFLLKRHRKTSRKSPLTELDHQLLINWFRIHLLALEKYSPQLKTYYLSSVGPFSPTPTDGILSVYDRVRDCENTDQWKEFIPDGVLAISHSQKDVTKSLLFFLEVDMSTEPLASPVERGCDLRQKVINYQTYFRTQRYKRYEEVWNCRFNGFRLLFMTNNANRATAVSRLVQEMPPSDFIWIADQEQMFVKGLGGSIWARGGKEQNPPQSILGSTLAFESPVIDQKS